MRTLTTLALAAFVGLCGMASGAELRVLTVGSTAVAAKAIAADFAKASGHSVSFAVTAPFKIDAELAAKRFDVLIVSVPHMEALATAGILRKETRTPVARVGVGLVVKAGAPLPDVSTAEKFKATLLAAKSLTYSDPAIPNLAGGVAATVLGKAGILDALKPKIKYADLGVGADLIKSGEIEMGFFNNSEILPGLAFVGTVPAPYAAWTFYEAAVLARTESGDAARALVYALADAAAAGNWTAAALEPAAVYRGTN
jgi:molybdate transport system substrate-binding protein